ncbi:2-phospho-L-lactate guanylyltransferase [Gordonia crocea]|uniref:Phosphoenolpyruvate guanylyltransferase n=1 Tax=Gordonia crocea TaxID=589162 RepID=A0A7I9V010_9ACTN|nr:2-phospho-L-lactate guanylyltransferase [Gordonia crocea]GED98410.1 2-phospho-L-lactate guanylyltransferase [Gordonia crocea]
MTWGAVLAVKPLSAAKSRLGGSDEDRGGLVLAMLDDVLAAVTAAGLVALVVTPDPEIASLAAGAGARAVGEPAGAAGLNAAFQHGQRALLERVSAVSSVVFLQADLPALTATQLRSALAAHTRLVETESAQSFVADSTGTGTAALLRPADLPDAPFFGSDSAAAHRRAGAHDLVARAAEAAGWTGLRRDVDTRADLADAARIGVGPATSRWLRARS